MVDLVIQVKTKLMGKLLINFSIIIVSIVLTTGCATNKKISVNKNQQNIVDTLTDEQKFAFEYTFAEANRYNASGNTDLAISMYTDCLKVSPNSAVVNYQLASIYYFKKDIIVATQYAEKAVSLNPENKWYLLLAANIYFEQSNFEKAELIFKKLIDNEPSNFDYYINLADVYVSSKKFKEAIKVYNIVENKFGLTDVIALQKSKIYIADNKKADALKELEKLAQVNNNDITYLRYIADFYVQNREINKAIEMYNNILLISSDDGLSNFGLAECYRIKGNIKTSLTYLKKAFVSIDIDSDTKIRLVINLMQFNDSTTNISADIDDLIVILKDLYKDNIDVKILFADYLIKSKQLEQARNELRGVVKIRKDKYMIWEQLILLEYEFSEWEFMFTESTEALEYFPNQSFLYFFNGFSAFQLSNYNQAVKSLAFGINLITKDDPMRVEYNTFLAESYHKLGYKDKAYKIFDDLLIDDSNNIMVLNNYAYYLSEDNTDLDKAEKMSKITITKEPENSTYLDTYAWILFKQKNYSQALIYIEKAVKNIDDISDVVIEHYGDILYFNQDIENAVIQWKRAKELGNGSGKLDQKIESKSFIE